MSGKKRRRSSSLTSDKCPVTNDPSDLACAQCGYNLRGLEGVARCPECGLEIDQTLATYDLSRSDPR